MPPSCLAPPEAARSVAHRPQTELPHPAPTPQGLQGQAAHQQEWDEAVGGELVGFAFVVELADLGGQSKLPAGVPVDSLIVY